MTPEQFEAHAEEFFDSMKELLRVKGEDYTPDRGDRLSNFTEVANSLGLDPMQVWAVYTMKHVTAILNHVKDGELASEPIESRFLDLANYALLGSAILKSE